MRHYFKQSQTIRKRLSKSSMCLVFSLCFSLPPFSASANITNDVSAILAVLNNTLDMDLSAIDADVYSVWQTLSQLKTQDNTYHGNVYSYLGTINGNITDVEDYLRYIKQNLPSSPVDYTSILNSFKTQEHNDSTRNWLMLSNIWERSKSFGGSHDILAGNAWWATNSAFALTRNQYSHVYPNENPNLSYTYSFPQFMSRWSSLLTYPISGDTANASAMQNWWKYFGRYSDSTGRPLSFTSDYPYTWFHFMADATRSNWVLRASEFASHTNEIESATMITAVDDGSDVNTNHVDPLSIPSFSVNDSDSALQLVSDFDVESLFPSLTGADPVLTVLQPRNGRAGFTVDFSVPSNIANFFRLASAWLWRVLFFVSLLFIVRSEFDYWSTLGGSAS